MSANLLLRISCDDDHCRKSISFESHTISYTVLTENGWQYHYDRARAQELHFCPQHNRRFDP